MSELTAAEMASLEKEAAQAKSGALSKDKLRFATSQPLPVRLVENIQLAQVTPHAIRKRLQGLSTQDGPIVGIEWLLIHYDSTAAVYAADCPYSFCDHKGTIEAMALIDSRGKIELPFAAPGSLACPECDSAIEKLYQAEAAKVKNPRRPSLITLANPKTCQGCETLLPVGAPANTRLCQPCATARALERKRLGMAKSRAETVAE